MKVEYIVGIVIVLAAGAYLLMGQNQNMSTGSRETTVEETGNGNEMAGENETAAEHTVVYSDDGYAPETVTVAAGTVVTFVNESSMPMWPATDVHPTHTEYPESNISNCGTAEAAQMFDACEGIEPGGSYSFEFNEVGTWEYHDHLNPTRVGEVIVE